MKKYFVVLMAALMVFAAGCSEKDKSVDVETNVCGYLIEIDGDKIAIDKAEYITIEDEERIAELGLKETDMPSGYFVYNPEEVIEEYTLTNGTVYDFVDWTRLFTKDGENMQYSTTKKDEFIEYISTYVDSKPKMPFFFDIEDDVIIKIREEMMA